MDLSVKVMCMAWCRCSSGRAAEKARPGDSNGPNTPRPRSTRQRSRLSAWNCASSSLSAASAQTQTVAF